MRSMFSVIIPTYNRSGSLRRTLDGYLNQTVVDLINEIIVIDDGSNEKHARDNKEIIEKHSQDSPFDIKYLWQDNKGPASARNNGIKNASGEYILLTGDDIIPHPDMVKQHYSYHKKHDFQENIGILGKISWPVGKKVTPFMEYINEQGLQFGFSLISNDTVVPYTFFYTSNISLQRKFLQKDKLFDIDFCYAAWEDIELSYRLKNRGFSIVYNENAIGYHHHNLSIKEFMKRQEKCGYAAYIFYQKHPELREFLSIGKEEDPSNEYKRSLFAMEAFCPIADKFIGKSYPEYYKKLSDHYYNIGMKRYIKENSANSHSTALDSQTLDKGIPEMDLFNRKPKQKVLIPPPELRGYVGEGDFISVGEVLLRYFIEYCHLKKDERVLDVGCGIGRLAVPLTGYLNPAGSYEGFDIVPQGIDWCAKNITTSYPNFKFQLANIYNKEYNPNGTIRPLDYKFPFNDGEFDFIFLTSVFTHMLPGDMDHYLSEINRVLKKNGRCCITYFIINQESVQLINEKKSGLQFENTDKGYYTINKETPEAAVAYEEPVLLDLYRKYGLKVEPIYYGNWCNRPKFVSYQDFIVAKK